jgi:site-specific recombinase XerD
MPRHPTLKDHQAKFENFVFLTCRRSTWKRYAGALTTFFSHFTEKKRVRDFTLEDVEKYKLFRRSEGIAKATLECELSVLRAFSNWLLDAGVIFENPASRR